MKKCVLVVLILFLIISVSGCVPSGYVSEDLESYKQAREILRCLDEEDVEGLKNLFCEKVASTHDLDKEIAEAMEFYQGKHESYSNILEGGGSSIRDGEYLDYHLGYWITDIETDKKKVYDIDTHSYLIYKEDTDFVGITYITIIDREADKQVDIGEYVK